MEPLTLFFFRNQDLTGGKINGEKIFVPSLEQTPSRFFSIGGPTRTNFFFTDWRNR
jgi:hypothetical protein